MRSASASRLGDTAFARSALDAMRRWKVVLTLILMAEGSSQAQGHLEPQVIEAPALLLSGATGEQREDGLRVLTTVKSERARAFTSGLKLDASTYDYVEIAVRAPITKELFFLWTTSADPDTVQGVALPRPEDDETMLYVGSHPEWRGSIEGIGIGWTGPLKAPITLGRLTLRPSSARAQWLAVWHEWTAFEGLKGYSMNFVIGGSALSSQRVRFVPAVAFALLLVLAVYGVMTRIRARPFRGGAAAAIVLAGWLLVDARWQWDLWRQARLTQERFEGKSVTEKKLADDDGELFRLVMALKQMLPETPQVVFLVSRDPEGADRYVALRTRYHLLPHNVNANYRYPPGSSEIPPGQYVLVIEPRDDIDFDEAAGRLLWETGDPADRGQLELERIHASPSISLYRRP